MESSASSKVTVEYHDPSGVFPLIANDIASRLPLRNLNWHSPPRPLRQIKSLHVEFVADKHTQDALKPPTIRTDSNGPSSLEIVRAGQDIRRLAVKERRHQIPGLKTSPYLKVYILRCDDKVGYKEGERKSIREWIKENVPSETKRENHDACEWLILHVVLPDTIAASEPRWREVSTKDADELKERPKSKTKWPGKADRTVFDRLRADFNESSKTGHDHVAQIRIPKSQVPPDLLPTPAIAVTLSESPQERENAWNDLITKFKTLILGPFDQRVRQYEADIAEQESRRSLPGWNFCTFFIHKEGLAKALESIGLVEDALAIYDELALDLETVLRDVASGKADGAATSFAMATDDIQDRVVGTTGTRVVGGNDHDTNENDDSNDQLSLFDKDYRAKIVRSDISAFDFLCYIFLRQKILILRLANARLARKELGTDDANGGEDLVLTSEVCWRASSFIHDASRVLRQELAQAESSSGSDLSLIEIDSLVCSWVYTVAGQVLDDTTVGALQEITKFDSKQTDLSNGTGKRSVSAQAMGANPYPQRTTSLYIGRDSMPPELRSLSFDDRVRGDKLLSTQHVTMRQEATKPAGLPGQAELATYRAELFSMRRNMLEQIGDQCGFSTGWRSLWQRQSRKPNENDPWSNSGSSAPNAGHSATLLVSPSLKNALQSETAFQARYESLTDAGIRHFLAATQNKSAERLMGDVALLKYQQQDFATAAAYFERIVPLYTTDHWDLMESKAVLAYAECLKKLQKTEQCIQLALTLAAKQCEGNVAFGQFRVRADPDEINAVHSLVRDAIDASRTMEKDVTRPLETYFTQIKVHRRVYHCTDSDRLEIQLRLCNNLGSALDMDEVSVFLTNADDAGQAIVFTSASKVSLSSGQNELRLSTWAVTVGAYAVDKIVLRAGKISLVQRLRSAPEPSPLGIIDIEPTTVAPSTHLSQCIYVYPRQNSFQAEVQRPEHISIDKARHVNLVLSAGKNKIDELMVHVKPTSAGLRLHLVDAAATGVQLNRSKATPGQLVLGSLDPFEEATVMIPYTVEQVVREIALRFEIRYATSEATLAYVGSTKILHELPLDVDVNDIFHLDTLFSSFTVRTTSRSPISIVGADLRESPLYAVEAPSAFPSPMIVFSSQPTNLVYKILRKSGTGQNLRRKDASLALIVRYVAFDKLVATVVRKQFTEDLEKSEFSSLLPLLASILMERFRQLVSDMDIETAALLNEVHLPDFDAIGWTEINPFLADDIQRPLQAWLRKWHMSHPMLAVSGIETMDRDSQEITITVDVPNVDYIFHASLDLPEQATQTSYNPPLAKIGEPIQAKLRIKHTNKWSCKSMFPNVPRVKIEGEDHNEDSFVFDVRCETETWLCSGRVRGHFKPEEGVDQEHDLLLVPLRLGTHYLPSVEVQVAPAILPNGQASNDEPHVTCQTHYESAAQLVTVVRGEQTSRVLVLEPASTVADVLPSRESIASVTEAG